MNYLFVISLRVHEYEGESRDVENKLVNVRAENPAHACKCIERHYEAKSDKYGTSYTVLGMEEVENIGYPNN